MKILTLHSSTNEVIPMSDIRVLKIATCKSLLGSSDPSPDVAHGMMPVEAEAYLEEMTTLMQQRGLSRPLSRSISTMSR
jgi:hypothetical protein